MQPASQGKKTSTLIKGNSRASWTASRTPDIRERRINPNLGSMLSGKAFGFDKKIFAQRMENLSPGPIKERSNLRKSDSPIVEQGI